MSSVVHIFGKIKDVAQRKSVPIQLILQTYLLISSTMMLPLAAEILSHQVQCFDEDSPSEIKAIDEGPSRAILKAGLSVVIYATLQIIVSVFCIVVLSRIYRVFTKQPIYIGIEAFASVFLLIICVYAFVHIVLLILFLAGIGEAKTCMEDVVKSGMRTWLAVMLPVFVLSIVSLLGICGLLVTTKVTSDKQSPLPRVRLVSTRSSASGPKMQSSTISQPMDFLQNPIDSFQRLRRPRLPSLRSLHASSPNSPILFEIPLTPQPTNESENQNKSDLIQNESNDIVSPLNETERAQCSRESEPDATRSFEYPNVWIDQTGSSGSNDGDFNWSWIAITTPTPEPANFKT